MIQTIVDGLQYGAVMALVAAGFSLVYGVTHVINLAHGVIVVLGAYLALYLWQFLGIDPLASVPIVAVVMFCLGYVFQRTLLQLTMRRANLMATLVVTLGVAYVLKNIMNLVFSPDPRGMRPEYTNISFDVGGVLIGLLPLIAFGASVVLIAALDLILRKSPLGRSIRAVAQQETGARLCAINVEHVYGLTFAIAAAFAGVAGVVIGMLFPFSADTEGHWTIYAFVVVVLGGVGSPYGALVGGLLLGLVSTLTTNFIGAAYPNLMMFLILVLMLFVRPNGLFGHAFGVSR